MNQETVADEMFRNKIETDAKVNQIENETKILEATSKQESIIRRDKNSEREDNARTDRVVTEETAKARIANSDANTHEELNKCDVDDRRNEVEHKKKKNDLEIQAKIQELNEKARKEVKVFVASNPEELEEERTALSALVAQINKILAPRNTNIIIKHSREIEILSEVKDELKASDMCVVLFCEELDKSSKEEMDEGFQEVKQTNNLKRVHVYFKETDTASEDIKSLKRDFTSKYGQRFFKFVNIDSLKLNFVMQLEEVQSKIYGDSMLKVQNSKVEFCGVPVADLKNIPFAANNETYQELIDDIAELEEDVLNNPENQRKQQKLFDKKEKLYKIENNLVKTAIHISNKYSRNLSKRLNEAIWLFESGNVKQADYILNKKDICNDARQNAQMLDSAKDIAEHAKQTLERNIKELIFKIDILSSEMPECWVNTVIEIYDEAINLAKGRIDDFELAYLMLDSADFRQENLQFNLIGSLYQDALAIFKKLRDKDRFYNLLVAISLNSYANYLICVDEYDSACDAHYEALGIFRKLAEEDSLKYNECVAISLNNLGNLHKMINEFELAEKEHLEALKIRENLSENISNDYQLDVAQSLHSLALMHKDLCKFTKAEEELLNALNIYRSKINAETYSVKSKIAGILNDLSIIHNMMKKYDEAEKDIKEAILINEDLAKKSPSISKKVAMAYHNLALLYQNTGEYSLAKDNYEHSLKLFWKLAEDNPNVYNSSIATTLNNLGNVNRCLNRFYDSEIQLKQALSIRIELATANPNVYDEVVAETFNNLGVLYLYKNDAEKSEENCLKALRIRKELANSCPNKFNNSVAKTLDNLAVLHYNITKRYNIAENYWREFILYNDIKELENSALNFISYCLFYQGKIDEAIQTIEKVIESEPIANYLDSKGEFLIRIGHRAKALEIYKQIIETTPTYFENNETKFYKMINEKYQ